MVPGLLKALQSNRNARFTEGVKLFEISDVMLLDEASDVGARNERHVGALYSGPTAGFEVIHGLVDRIMALLEVPARPFKWAAAAASAAGGDGPAPAAFSRAGKRYYIEPAGSTSGGSGGGGEAIPSYFPGRGARIVLEGEGGDKRVLGSFGVLHPKVLANFELSYPATVLELNIEPLE